MAIQIARARGAEVFATGSPTSKAAIERLGANFVDRSEAVEEFVTRLTGARGFDLVYDTVAGSELDRAFVAVCRFGHVVSSLGRGRMRWRRYRSAPRPIPAFSPCCRS